MRRAGDGFVGSARARAPLRPRTKRRRPPRASGRPAVSSACFRSSAGRHASTTGRPFSWMRAKELGRRPATARVGGDPRRGWPGAMGGQARATLEGPSTHWRAASGGSHERSGLTTPRTTVLTLQQKKDRGEPITMLTAYDFPTARSSTTPASTRSSSATRWRWWCSATRHAGGDDGRDAPPRARGEPRRARARSLIGDMPFMSYQADPAEAVRNAGRFLKEGGMDAVKLEGGARRRRDRSARSCAPASRSWATSASRRRASTRSAASACRAARPRPRPRCSTTRWPLEEAGCFAIVLESVPDRVAAAITDRAARSRPSASARARAPTARCWCSHDLLGLYDRFTPKFAARYAELGAAIERAVAGVPREVESRAFPGREHSYAMPEEEWQAFQWRRSAPARRGRARAPVSAALRAVLVARHGSDRPPRSARALARRGEAASTLAGTWREALAATRRRGGRSSTKRRAEWRVPSAACRSSDAGPADARARAGQEPPDRGPALAVAARAARHGGVVLTLQNGLGNREVLGARPAPAARGRRGHDQRRHAARARRGARVRRADDCSARSRRRARP